MKSRWEEQRHAIEHRLGRRLTNLLGELRTQILVLGVCLLAETVLPYTMKANKLVCYCSCIINRTVRLHGVKTKMRRYVQVESALYDQH